MTQLYRGLPDLVVSGINKGYNLGDDVTYSGTVAGAMEGSFLGVPSIAVSLNQCDGTYDFSHAAAVSAAVAAAVFERGLPAGTFLNINVPIGRPAGVRVTVQGKRNHVTVVAERTDPRGRPYYWIEEGEKPVGTPRSVRLSGGSGRVCLGDAAAAGSDGARCPGGHRAAGRAERFRGQVAG